METIYSHLGIMQEEINSQFDLKTDSDEIIKYDINYNKDLVVDMPFKGKTQEKSHDRNSCGWKADKNYYFKELFKKHPEYFSTKNEQDIKRTISPKIDKQFVNFFPEYEEFIGDTIIHHHIGQDGQAVGIPASLHRGYGVVHNTEKALGITRNGLEFSQQVQALVDTGVEFSWDKADEIMDSVIATRLIRELEKVETAVIRTETQVDMKTEGGFKPVPLVKKVQRSGENIVKYVVENVKPKQVIKVVLVGGIVAGGIVVIAKNPKLIREQIKWVENQVKKIRPRTASSLIEKGGGTLAKKGKKLLKSAPISFIAEKGVSQQETELVSKVVSKVVVEGITSNFGVGMDKVSVFKSDLDLYKSGLITIEQYLKNTREIAELTGKNPKQWLGLLSSRFKDPIAEVLIKTL